MVTGKLWENRILDILRWLSCRLLGQNVEINNVEYYRITVQKNLIIFYFKNWCA